MKFPGMKPRFWEEEGENREESLFHGTRKALRKQRPTAFEASRAKESLCDHIIIFDHGLHHDHNLCLVRATRMKAQGHNRARTEVMQDTLSSWKWALLNLETIDTRWSLEIYVSQRVANPNYCCTLTMDLGAYAAVDSFYGRQPNIPHDDAGKRKDDQLIWLYSSCHA
ncbi:hypothetical protein VNO77_03889 [Canavalia gladiata]|uniref:Uncharacterized protein n=1 Tax=Canavalia gladiata TaxID=3824 RepID=A0AAN9R4B9_CANGL